jgi:hypothetical protein
MNKRYITGYITKIVNERNTHVTKVDMIWRIDFSRLPYMGSLLDFLSLSLNNNDFNNVSKSLVYWDSRYYTFSFTTTGYSKVSEKDIYNEDTGYRIALIKNQKKAMETYNRLISVIQEKVNKYFIKPLEKIELRNSLDTIDLHMKLDEYKHKQI